MLAKKVCQAILAASGRDGAARLWEQVVRARTRETSEKHLSRLAALEKRHAMRLPSISDKLAERFVKPFAVDRMTALLAQAIRDALALADDKDTIIITGKGHEPTQEIAGVFHRYNDRDVLLAAVRPADPTTAGEAAE